MYNLSNSSFGPYLTAVLVLVVVYAVSKMFGFGSHWDPKGKFFYVTGGSQGLGKAVAIYLVKNGASDVVIVARSVKALQETEAELKALTKPGQNVSYISADLTTAEGSEKALETARERHGRYPEEYIMCAGSSRPKYFVDHTREELQRGLDGTYWVQAWTAHAACKALIAECIKGHICFVSSFCGYSTFVGYSSYSPGKYAVRALADTLRNEMLLHDIKITMFMPAGISSPGYEEEQKCKPAATKKLEESDKIDTPEQCANYLVKGLKKGYYQPTTYFITDLMRVGSKGGVPMNNPLIDGFWWIVVAIAMPIWVMIMDSTVKGFKKEVQADLTKRKFYRK